MRKRLAWTLALILMLTGCTSGALPEKPTVTENKFEQQTAEAPAQAESSGAESTPAENTESSAETTESTQPTAEESSAPAESSTETTESSTTEAPAATPAAVDTPAAHAAPVTGNTYGTYAEESQLTTIEQYAYDGGSYKTFISAFKNNLSQPVDVTMELIAYGSDGAVLSTDHGFVNAVAPGQEAAVVATSYADPAAVDHMEYAYYYGDSYYDPAYYMMEDTLSYWDDQLTIQLTNVGSEDITYSRAVCLFFDENDQFAEYGTAYFWGPLAPGQLDVQNVFTWNGSYPNCMVYFDGYSNGTVTEIKDPATYLETVAVYEYEPFGGYQSKAAVVKNISGEKLTIYGEFITRDANGIAVNVASDYIDILAPGETSILAVSYSVPEGLPGDSTELRLNVQEDNGWYEAIIGDLSATGELEDGKLNISITNNNATVIAKYVKATVIFFDEANNVLEFDYTYVDDDNGNIQPGATETDYIYAPYNGFDHFEIYIEADGELPD